MRPTRNEKGASTRRDRNVVESSNDGEYKIMVCGVGDGGGRDSCVAHGEEKESSRYKVSTNFLNGTYEETHQARFKKVPLRKRRRTWCGRLESKTQAMVQPLWLSPVPSS